MRQTGQGGHGRGRSIIKELFLKEITKNLELQSRDSRCVVCGHSE